MAQRRMFSLKVIDTDEFLDMPQTTQLLYYNLAMRADDDGFIGNPKKIMRISGCGDDDMKVLIVKKFVIPFESGICVIRHWRIHNYIQSDRYCETQYIEEKDNLLLLNNGIYEPKNNLCIQDVYKKDTQVRLGKVRDKTICETSAEVIAEPFSFNSYLEEMASDKRRHIQIIALYWKWRGIKFDTKKLAQEAINRDCRPAKALVDYLDKEITDTMDYIDSQKFIIKPTLETVGKYIAELKAGNI